MTSLSQKSINNSLTRANSEEIVSWGLPDYSAGVSVSKSVVSSSPFTAPYKGFVIISTYGSGQNVLINGTVVAQISVNTYGTLNTMTFPVENGDEFYFSSTVSSSDYVGNFYPMKGA